MNDDAVEYPEPSDATLVRRISMLPSGAKSWRGNGARAQADHHELVNPGSGPLYLHLEWTSPDNDETVIVGDYWINVRGLIAGGFAQEKGKQARLRFVRWVDGTVIIQANDSSPWIGVGFARFDA